jgi:Polyketide cyclase / dehydrase and lipid transport
VRAGPVAGSEITVRQTSRNQAWFDTTPDAIWRYVGDARTYPDWVVGAAESRKVDPEYPQPGATLHHTQGVPKVGLKDTSTVVDSDPPADLELEVRIRPFAVNGVRFILRGDGDGRTHVTMLEWPKSGVVARLMGPFFVPALMVRNAETLRRLRSLSEAQSA